MSICFAEQSKKTLDFFKSIIGNIEWEKRHNNIKKFLQEINCTEEDELNIIQKKQNLKKDYFGLCLYTLTNIINTGKCNDPILAGRLYPFFTLIGTNIEKFKSILHVEKKIKDLFKNHKNDPFPTLYEFIVAIYYLQNGWNVTFIPESKKEKRPDLKATKNDMELYIECKFLSKDYDYAKIEHKKILELWSNVIIKCPDAINKIFDIKFKTPLKILEEEFLSNLISKIVKDDIKEYENDQVMITTLKLDVDKINHHLSNNDVNINSSFMINLIFDEYNPINAYNVVYVDDTGFFYDYNLNIKYPKSLKSIFCLKWKSLSDEAIYKRSRYIFNKIKEGMSQLTKKDNKIIHVGYETVDDAPIETEKLNKLYREIDKLELQPDAIFINAFIGVSTLDNFEILETCHPYYFNSNLKKILPDCTLINETKFSRSTGHWNMNS